VYICDFHREQSWLRWTALSKHGVANVCDELLELLRQTARALDVEAFDDALQQLQSSRIWQKHAALQNWFKKTWLPHKQVGLRVLCINNLQSSSAQTLVRRDGIANHLL